MNEQKMYIMWEPLNSIPGLKFRYFAGDDDYQIRLDIFDKCREVEGIEWVMTLD